MYERACRKIFEYLFKAPFPKNRDFKHPISGNYLELDGLNTELKIAFEYNGEQHYKRVKKWNTEEEFLEQIERDKIVEKLCSKNMIKLIIIPYTVKYNDLYSYIINKFPEYNFQKEVDPDILKYESSCYVKLENVRKYVLDKFEATLVSSVYVNNTTNLDFLCKNNHSIKVSSKDLYGRINFCEKCVQDNKINSFCAKYEYELISVYTSAKDDLLWRCLKCNETITRKWYRISGAERSHDCINDLPMPRKIEKLCETNNYELLDEFIDVYVVNKWKCLSCNFIFEISWANLRCWKTSHCKINKS